MKTLDCRGLACPAPVLQVKEAIEKDCPETLKILLDNEAAKENVSRFLASQNYTASSEKNNGNFVVTGNRGEASVSSCEIMFEAPGEEQKKIMVMVGSDRLGRGDDELGGKLMINFLKTLNEMGNELWRLVFVNNGVKLTVEEAETLPDLKALEEAGVMILVCGTCLNYFSLLDKKKVGETTNMLDIVTAMQLADTVINV